MSNGHKDDAGKSLIVGGFAGGIAALVNRLLAGKPAEAAEDRWDDLLQSQAAIILLLEELKEAIAGLSIAVSVQTPWVAKDPEQIYSQDIRVIGTFFSDMMVDWTKGKRLVIKVESSLDQTCQIYSIGNYVDDMNLASDINGPINVAAGENHSVGLAWDDWHPFIGVRITTAIAPAAGILNIWAVIQE